ncbi:tyrosine-type recombinase/integrase [Actinoallomurus vinaceus]
MGVKNDGSPDRRHVTAKGEKEVTKKVRELEAKRDAGKVDKPGRPPTVEKWMTYWLTTVLPLKQTAPNTINAYWSDCRNWIFPNIGRHRIDRCQPEHLEALYSKMFAAGKKPSHVRKVHAIISSAYSVAVRRQRVGRNPAELVQPPRLDNPELKSLTRDEARAVLAEAQQRPNGARWSVGLSCGLRQGEVLGLRWPYLVATCLGCDHSGSVTGWWATDSAKCPKCGDDRYRVEARVWFQLQRTTWRHGCDDPTECTKDKHRRPCPDDCPKAKRTSGRRHKCVPEDAKGLCPKKCERHASTCPKRTGGGLVFRPIKERRKKTIALADELVEVLRHHFAWQERQRKRAGSVWEGHDLVFCQPNGRPIDPRHDWDAWAGLLRSAGLPHYRVHAARHTAATLLLEQGVALAVVQEILGHSDIRVTRGYTHVASPLVHDAAQRIGQALFTANETKNETGDDEGRLSEGETPTSRTSRLSESNRRPIHYE